MRKFFKSLAVLLALTLIVGVIPAAAADSLSMQKEKVLYIDGSKGKKEDGTQCKTGAKKLVANMIKGFDKDTMNVDLKSADESIVKTTKAGRIVAKSLGTTTVKVVVEKNGEEYWSQDLKVIVKKNASEITVGGALVEGESYMVGDEIDVTLPRKGVDTDGRNLVADKDSASLVEIKEGESARTYKVKFLKAGDVRLIATAYQSSKYPKPTVTKEISVKVTNPIALDVKQVADNKIALTYSSNIKDIVTASSFKNEDVFYKIDESVVPFSLIQKVEAEDNVATLTFYSTFVAGTSYFVKVNDTDTLTFVGAGHDLKDVTDIKITMTKAYKNKDNIIDFKYLNGDLDITKGVTEDYSKNMPTFEVTSDYAYSTTAMVDGQNRAHVYFTESGKVAHIKAKLFIGYDETTYTAIEKIDEIDIVSTDEPTAQYTGEVKYSIVSSAKAHFGKDDATKADLAIGDLVNFQVLLQQKGTDGKLTWKNAEEYEISKVECANENIAVIGNPVGNGNTFAGYSITGISDGTTNVILYKKDASGKDVFVRAFPITVKKARVATSYAIKADNSNLNINKTDGIGDKSNIYITVFDQYGEWMDNVKWAGSITLGQAPNNADQTKATLVAPSFNRAENEKTAALDNKPSNGFFTLDANSFTYTGEQKKGQQIYFALEESTKNIKSNYSITVMDAPVASTNKWEVSASKDTLDTGLISTTMSSSSNVTSSELVIKKSFNGFKTGTEPFKVVSAKVTANTTAQSIYGAATGAAVYLVYAERDSSQLTPDADTVVYTANAGDASYTDKITLNNITGTPNQLAKGAYKFYFYKYEVKTAGATPVINTLAIKNVNVTNNQTMPTVTVKSDKVPSNGNYVDCFTFKFGNDDVTASATINGAQIVPAQNGNVFVKAATVTLPSCYGYGAGKTIEVTVNKLLTK